MIVNKTKLSKFHRIFASDGTYVSDIEFTHINDGSLPQWFFDGNFFNFEVNVPNDTIEWVPPVGPAPSWKAKYSKFKTPKQIWKSFSAWSKRTY